MYLKNHFFTSCIWQQDLSLVLLRRFLILFYFFKASLIIRSPGHMMVWSLEMAVHFRKLSKGRHLPIGIQLQGQRPWGNCHIVVASILLPQVCFVLAMLLQLILFAGKHLQPCSSHFWPEWSSHQLELADFIYLLTSSIMQVRGTGVFGIST